MTTLIWAMLGMQASTCHPANADSAYLTFDIIRRIMEDYFGYHMFICMNITDIDDKIIITSRKRHLLQNYAKKNYEITETVLKDLNVSLQAYITSEEEKLNKIKVCRPL